MSGALRGPGERGRHERGRTAGRSCVVTSDARESMMPMEDDEFVALYGRWAGWGPSEVTELFRGAPFRWWVVGGWALELATGRARPHDDIDVAFPRADLPLVREHLRAHHLWVAQEGSLTPLDRFEELPDDHGQLWMRTDATGPWLVDLLLQPVEDDEWVFKKDRSIKVPMADAVRQADVPHLVPELVLLHKAHLDRPKDRADLAATLPYLPRARREWLAEQLGRVVPGSGWTAAVRLGGCSGDGDE